MNTSQDSNDDLVIACELVGAYESPSNNQKLNKSSEFKGLTARGVPTSKISPRL